MADRRSVIERFPITSNNVIDRNRSKSLEQVLIEKVCQLFRNLLKAKLNRSRRDNRRSPRRRARRSAHDRTRPSS
ncbi:hypothetical protein C5688_02695 [Methylocystis sp. MitZ-2018]|nr:hypothetical protein C5688_02695 [Methylocystis sp. MitZ-2018]